MTEARVTYPSGLPRLLRMPQVEFEEELLFLAAAKLYELGRLSSGKAAELAGVDRVSFLYALGRYGVPAINLLGEEIVAEIGAARVLSG